MAIKIIPLRLVFNCLIDQMKSIMKIFTDDIIKSIKKSISNST